MSDLETGLGIGGVVGFIAGFAFTLYFGCIKEPSYFHIPPEGRPEPQQQIVYDVNQDGIQDLVDWEGNVKLGRADGTFVSLYDAYWDEHLRLIAKYSTFVPDARRNSVDNLDYGINTGSGRYVLAKPSDLKRER